MSNFIEEQKLRAIQEQNQLLAQRNQLLTQQNQQLGTLLSELKLESKNMKTGFERISMVNNGISSSFYETRSEINGLETQNYILWLVIIIMIIMSWIRHRKVKSQQEEMEKKLRKTEDRLFNFLLIKGVDKQEKKF